jgi:poly(A) polymerase
VSGTPDRLLEEPAVRTIAEAAAGIAPAWIVGGTVRDALLDRGVTDVDLAVEGDPEAVARAVARALHGPAFRLSEQFGAWRAIDGGRRFVCDVSPLQGATIEDDLAQRDFSVNAMAVPLAGGEILDPHRGRADLDAGTLRVLGEGAYAADPLRPLRLARLATELPLAPDRETEWLTRAAAPKVAAASGERMFAELRRIVIADGVLEGLALCDRLGLTDAVLPELSALRGVEQSHFHHLDVHEHTLEVLRRLIELERTLDEAFRDLTPALRGVLAEPLADELTRSGALRLAALLHDIGKPATRGVRPDGRVTFIGHDSIGEDMVRAVCRRLRTSERLASFLGTVTRTHLALGFLVHDRPLGRRAVYRYLKACRPVEVEVTLLSCADRLATRGRNAGAAIAAHLEVARTLMEEALAWRLEGPPRAPIRGDDLARELGIRPGPRLGRLLEEIEEARFAGEVETRADAVEYARRHAPAAEGSRSAEG